MSGTRFDRLVLSLMIVGLLRVIVLLRMRLLECEQSRAELRNRIAHLAPPWRRRDHDFDGARW